MMGRKRRHGPREPNGRASRKTEHTGRPPNRLDPTPQAQHRRQLAAGIAGLSRAEIEAGLGAFVTAGPDAKAARLLLRAATTGDPVKTTSTLDLMLTRGLITEA